MHLKQYKGTQIKYKGLQNKYNGIQIKYRRTQIKFKGMHIQYREIHACACIWSSAAVRCAGAVNTAPTSGRDFTKAEMNPLMEGAVLCDTPNNTKERNLGFRV